MKGADTFSYEVTDFQRDVLETSRTTPVLVDFWAPWCGPCRTLGPTLEKLAEENQGEWKLVKVNTDQHPELSARYQIRGIPAVKLIVDGEVVDEFTGVLPEYAITQWLEKALPSEAKQRLEEAERAIDAGDDTHARQLLETVLREEPENPKAKILLARLVAFTDPTRAVSLVDSAAFAGPQYLQMGEAVKALAAFEQATEEPSSLPDESGKEHYLAAANAMKDGDFDAAIAQLIEVLKVNRYFQDDGARKAGVALFTLLGDQHEVTRKYRRTFDMWLY